MNVRQKAPSESTVDVHADGDGSPTATLQHSGIRHGGGGLAEKFREQPVLNTLLVAVCIAAIVLAYTAIGPASPSSGQSTRTTTVKRGVVQSTVSGSGNIQSADQLNLGFKTSGTVTHIYVKTGAARNAGTAARHARPQERRSHAGTVQGDPSIGRSEPRERGRKRRRNEFQPGFRRPPAPQTRQPPRRAASPTRPSRP